jgi:hypothetical protein
MKDTSVKNYFRPCFYIPDAAAGRFFSAAGFLAAAGFFLPKMGLSSSSSILSKSSLSLAFPLAPFLGSALRALEGFQEVPASESESENARLGCGAGLGFSATGFFFETPKSESSPSSISDLTFSSSSSVLSHGSFFFLGAENDEE